MDDVVIRTSNPWNKGNLIGQKAPFKLKEIWAIRIPASNFRSNSGIGAFQPRHRQQAQGLRSRQVAGS